MNPDIVYCIRSQVQDGPSLTVLKWCLFIGIIVTVFGIFREAKYRKYDNKETKFIIHFQKYFGLGMMVFGVAYFVITTGYLFPPNLNKVIRENYDTHGPVVEALGVGYVSRAEEQLKELDAKPFRSSKIKEIIGTRGGYPTITLGVSDINRNSKGLFDVGNVTEKSFVVIPNYTKIEPYVEKSVFDMYVPVEIENYQASALLQYSKLSKVYKAPEEVRVVNKVYKTFKDINLNR